MKILPHDSARSNVIRFPAPRQRQEWNPPKDDKELVEEIRWWRWAVKYSIGTPYAQTYANRLNACLYAQKGLFQ